LRFIKMDNHQANLQQFESTNGSNGSQYFGSHHGPSASSFNQFTPVKSQSCQSNEVHHGSNNSWYRMGGASRDGHRGF
ncbi:hypothetical protein PRIPAC_85409, partial [Pristionchus pacificus]|uniref:Uncharacterized protein n=1 Tax=Pristionchus pacificus TaxID=54126 RepID=A0A2A6BLP7_PRIPA